VPSVGGDVEGGHFGVGHLDRFGVVVLIQFATDGHTNPPALPAHAQERWRYVFNQSIRRIGFSARHLGLFTSSGQFDRFQVTLLIYPTNPSNAAVDCLVETREVSIPFPGATDSYQSA